MAHQGFEELTTRERQILWAMMNGASAGEIGPVQARLAASLEWH
jgi:DNA-binding NarL/FixJ family response regulator